MVWIRRLWPIRQDCGKVAQRDERCAVSHGQVPTMHGPPSPAPPLHSSAVGRTSGRCQQPTSMCVCVCLCVCVRACVLRTRALHLSLKPSLVLCWTMLATASESKGMHVPSTKLVCGRTTAVSTHTHTRTHICTHTHTHTTVAFAHFLTPSFTKVGGVLVLRKLMVMDDGMKGGVDNEAPTGSRPNTGVSGRGKVKADWGKVLS